MIHSFSVFSFKNSNNKTFPNNYINTYKILCKHKTHAFERTYMFTLYARVKFMNVPSFLSNFIVCLILNMNITHKTMDEKFLSGNTPQKNKIKNMLPKSLL